VGRKQGAAPPPQPVSAASAAAQPEEDRRGKDKVVEDVMGALNKIKT
jgi:hypothetical protein